MSGVFGFARRVALRHLPRRTVRLRLTFLYGGLYLVSGAALLAVTYILVHHAVSGQVVSGQTLLAPHDGGGLHPRDAPGPGPGSSGGMVMEMLPPEAAEAMERQRSNLLYQLLVQSGIALGIMSLISLALGWIVAGRILRPLRTITAAARDISATSLNRRLALPGPSDELKELGDTIDDLLSRLEASFQAQRHFVANASHELRTPLARQRTLGQVALSDPEASVESLRAAHERILVAGAQQERLIEALLTLTRGQAGIEVRQPFDLRQLTQEVVGSRTQEAALRSVTLRARTEPATAAGHRNLAERLIVNLVDNAIKHNVENGWVDVSLRMVADQAVLTVANSGAIVPPEAVERLFQPFQRFGTARTGGRRDGLGLGLSIVQAIAAAHKARLTVVAPPEGGLVTTVYFAAASVRQYES
ncbi:ATP-binding protein [Microbispora sp. NPDC088329]|uniref:sensor histidine kinase n=1 Tax=Microbispora sp. NPDC088329 TaxID=3154869 RepID=UPI00342066FE